MDDEGADGDLAMLGGHANSRRLVARATDQDGGSVAAEALLGTRDDVVQILKMRLAELLPERVFDLEGFVEDIENVAADGATLDGGAVANSDCFFRNAANQQRGALHHSSLRTGFLPVPSSP